MRSNLDKIRFDKIVCSLQVEAQFWIQDPCVHSFILFPVIGVLVSNVEYGVKIMGLRVEMEYERRKKG